MTAPVMIFPDVEDVLTRWLATELASRGRPIVVSTRIPNPRPASFVRVIRTGGVLHTLVTDAAQVTVECFAATETAAVTIALLVRGLIHSLPGRMTDPTVYLIEEAAGPANYPDPTTAAIRYVQTFVIHLRGLAAPN